MEKMKTYVLILSKTFPKTHSRAGGLTYFRNNFEIGQLSTRGLHSKLHTIRPLEKDLKLTWGDMREIYCITLNLREHLGASVFGEPLYQEVLKRFKEWKEE